MASTVAALTQELVAVPSHEDETAVGNHIEDCCAVKPIVRSLETMRET